MGAVEQTINRTLTYYNYINIAQGEHTRKTVAYLHTEHDNEQR